MKIIKFIILIILLLTPFIINVLRKNMYFTKSSLVIELRKEVQEKEREFEELKGIYISKFSPTQIESLSGLIGLKKNKMKDFLILE